MSRWYLAQRKTFSLAIMKKSNVRWSKTEKIELAGEADTRPIPVYWECQCRQRWIQKVLSTNLAAQRSTQSWLIGSFSLLTSSMMDERAAFCTQLSKLQKKYQNAWSKYCTTILYHNRNLWHDGQKHSLRSWRRRSYINCCGNAGWLSPASSAVVWFLHSTAS